METPDPGLIFSLRRVTEAAACAAFNWIGRGDSQDAGRAALDAMRAALGDVDIDAVVAIGEATRGEAPQPQRGERLGRPGAAFKADVARRFLSSAYSERWTGGMRLFGASKPAFGASRGTGRPGRSDMRPRILAK
jgi:hypothetical protein